MNDFQKQKQQKRFIMKTISKETEKKKIGFFSVLFFILTLWLISLLVSSFFTYQDEENVYGNVAVIKLYGGVSTTPEDGFMSSGFSANEIISLLDKAEKDNSIQAIVLDINSGGGAPVGSDEIGKKLKSMNKTKVALIRDIGASGAYWIASDTDYIIANRMSLVGSIGVIGSYLELSGLLDRYNMTYRRIVSGKYKDSGSPLKELTPDEEKMLQSLVDELHGYFIEEVAKNRNMTIEEVKKIATGEVFTGQKAFELGLIDKVGGIDDATYYLETKLNSTIEYKVLEKKSSFTDLLRTMSAEHGFSVGKGMASFLYNQNTVIKT